jgi:hypothetical protein
MAHLLTCDDHDSMIIILAPHFCAKDRTRRMNAIDAMLKAPEP